MSERVRFDINGDIFVLQRAEAEQLAEKLRVFAAGGYSKDVELLASVGVDPDWPASARLIADVTEDVLTDARRDPIPLDPDGKAAPKAVDGPTRLQR